MASPQSTVITMVIVIIIGEVSALVTTSNRLKAEKSPVHLVENLRKQIRAKEMELENAETVNRNFERMIQAVNILGQIDTFLTERTKAAVKKLAVLVDADEDFNFSEEEYDRSSRNLED